MNPTDGHPALPRALPARREEAVVGGGGRGLARDGAGGAVAAGRAAAVHDRALRGEIEMRLRNLDDNARLLYYSGQQTPVGDADRGAAALAVGVRRARPCRGPAWASGIAAALFAVLLVLAWFAGRPRRAAAPTIDAGGSAEYLEARPPMRPILVNIPAKPLFVVLLWSWRRPPPCAISSGAGSDKSAPWSSTSLYLLVGAGLAGSGSRPRPAFPGAARFVAALDAGPDLRLRRDAGDVAGRRLVPGDAARQAGRHRPAGGRHDLHVDGGLVDHRLARCSASSPTLGVRQPSRSSRWSTRAAWSPTAA